MPGHYVPEGEIFSQQLNSLATMRHRSSARSSMRSAGIEKPLSSQVSPKYYGHRRQTTPASRTFTSMYGEESSMSRTESGSLGPAPSYQFNVQQQTQPERPATWHPELNDSGEASGRRPASNSTTSYTRFPFNQASRLPPYTNPAPWPQTNPLASDPYQPINNEGLLYGEVQQKSSWFESTYPSSDFRGSTFYLDSTPAVAPNANSFFGYQQFQEPPQPEISFFNQPVSASESESQRIFTHETDQTELHMMHQKEPTTAKVEKDLVGLGLYDKGDSGQIPEYSGSLLFNGPTSQTLSGKGLKLEETWQPPPEPVPEAEEDDGHDSPIDDVPQPLSMYQPPVFMQPSEKLEPQNFTGQSFFFDDEFEGNGTSWLSDTGYTAQVPFDFGQYGLYPNHFQFF